MSFPLARRFLVPGLVLGTLAFFIVVPLLMSGAQSFLGQAARSEPPFLTLAHYRDLWAANWLWTTITNTLSVGVVSTMIAFLCGTPIAWLVARGGLPGSAFLKFLCTSPLFFSPLQAAVAWDLVGSPNVGVIDFLTFGLFQPDLDLQGFWGCAVVMGFYFSTFVFLYLWAAFSNVDPAIEEAASVAGLGPIGTFFRITLPLVMPAIAFVAVLVFVLAIGLFSVPAALGWQSGFYVLSTRIFLLLSVPPVNWGMASAVTVSLLPFILAGLFVQKRLVRRGDFTLVSGKSSRDGTVRLGDWRWMAIGFIGLYWIVVTGLPLTIMFVISLCPYSGNYEHLDFKQYRDLLNDDLFLLAVQNSLVTSLIGATLAIATSILLSYVIQRIKTRWTVAVDYLVSLPLSIPGVVLSAALLWTWLALPLHEYIYNTLVIIIIACITQFLTSGVRAVSTVLVQIGRDIEESAWVAGATRGRTLAKILVPMMLPGIQSGWILLFILFFRELSAVVLLWSSRTITLPVITFEVWREGSYARLAALGVAETVILATTVLLANILLYMARRLVIQRAT